MGASTGGVTSRKRSAPSDALTPQLGRPLAPKQPSAFGSESTVKSSITGYPSISPMVEPPPRLDEPRKKRGRPTKQEAEERRRKMEARQQLRLQAQVQVQPSQAAETAQHSRAYGAQFGSPAQPLPAAAASQIPREGTPTVSIAPQPSALSQTPRGQSMEEHNSSGSSGKKRRARAPRPSVSETEPPPPPFYPMPPNPPDSTRDSPPRAGSHLGGRPPHPSRSSAFTTSISSIEPDLPAYDPGEEYRPANPRSRPWEVRDRPGMS
ncbi:hypothetical protein, variant [Verruconis gallopava]|nr:hypothetical protein, variant [Verruconis gallopava]KIV99919.1 hypothetical protein, variant [Verruconis gallopava]